MAAARVPRGFSTGRAAETFYKFREIENRTNDDIEVVLVSVDSLRQVQRAYPNYFLDCKDFIENLKEVCQRIKAK